MRIIPAGVLQGLYNLKEVKVAYQISVKILQVQLDRFIGGRFCLEIVIVIYCVRNIVAVSGLNVKDGRGAVPADPAASFAFAAASRTEPFV